MRLAIIAAAASASRGEQPVIGERDAELIRDRLSMADLDFEVVVLDPAVDLAEQLDEVLTSVGGEVESLVLYGSCLSAVVDGEAYLCLDPGEPDIGDSLRDLVEGIGGRAADGTLLVLDVRCQDPQADHRTVRGTTDAIQACVDAKASGVELIAAARPLAAHAEQIPSRLTVGLLEAIDSRRDSLTAKEAYARAIQSTNMGSWPTAVVYAPASASLMLRPDDAPRISEEISVDLGPDSSGLSRAAPASSEKILTEAGPDSSGARRSDAPRISEEISVDLDSDFSELDSDAPLSDEISVDTDEELPASDPGVSAGNEESPISSSPAPSSKAQRKRSSAELLASVSPDESLPHPIDPPLPPAAQPSERAEVASTVARKRGSTGQRKTPLPKVMLGGSASSRKPGDPDETQPSTRLTADLAAGALTKGERDAPSSKRDAPSSKRGAPSSKRGAPSSKRGAAKSVKPERTGSAPSEASPLPSSAVPESEPKPSSGSVAAEARKAKRPADWTVDDHMGAGDEAVAAQDNDRGLTHFKKALGKLGTASTPQRAAIYIRIGKLMQERGKARVAISNFDKALAITPDDAEALAVLIELHVMQKNWRAVVAAEERLLATLADTEPQRLEVLLAFGQRWHEQGKDSKRAQQRYEEARDAFPDEPAPLERLLLIYEEEDRVEHVLDARRRLATLVEDPRRRGELYLALGRYCMELGRDDEGMASLELAIDSDPSLIEALEALAGYLGESQEWGELERVYTKAISNFSVRDRSKVETSVMAELYHRQAMLFRDHLEDPESALTALEGALELRPKQLATQLLAAEVATDLDDPGRALGYLRAATMLKPRQVDTYHRLFALGQQYDEIETSFLSSSVATILGEADERESIVYREHRVEGVPPHKRPLKAEAWDWLRCSNEVSAVNQVMRAISPAVLRLRVGQLRDANKLPNLPEDGRQDIENSTVSAVRSIVWACQYLGFGEVPSLYINDRFKGLLQAPFAPQQSIVIGRKLLSGRSLGELAFLIGRHLARRMPEHELVAHMQSVDELSACFLAGIKMILGSAPASGKLAKTAGGLANSLAKHQTAEERDELKVAVEEFSSSGGRVDLKAWIASVDRCATRVGYVLCGDLQTAVNLLRTEKLGIDSEDVESHVDDLCTFAVSGFNIKLRRALGSYIH